MGWIELEESQVAPHNMSEPIGDCISTLAQKRKDLWNTAETWGEVNIAAMFLVFQCLRWLKRVFNCYNPFEAMKDYKKLFLTI